MPRWSSAVLVFLVLGGLSLSAQSQAQAPVWPSLGEQLAADGVAPGSALAKLIAANQDFWLLRTAETRDQLRLPLWLRVAWRKAHPELSYPADDPTGGYPLLLQEIHEWMVSHQDLRPGTPGVPGTVETPELERSAVESGEQRTSGAQSSPRSESDIRVNPWNPLKIVGAANNIGGSGGQAQHYSTDGGATWGQSILPLRPGDSFQGDPSVDWTSDGTAWTTTIGISSGFDLRMYAYKSTDNGATWTYDATFSGSQVDADKEILWADHSATSPFKDNLYVIWHDGAPVYVNRRNGPGGSWGTPALVSGAETTGTGIGSDIKTNASGDVFGFWPDTGSRRIFMIKSTNGGVSYSTPAQVATTFESFQIGVPAFNSRQALIYVSGAAWRTASKDMVYAAWSDLSGAPGCTSPGNAPGSNTASTCKTRVWFTRSANGGATWSPAVMINNQASLNDQFSQWLTVDEATGALAIMYFDTVGDPGRLKVDVWYQSSFDDGVTWSAPFKVTSAQTDETAAGADSGNQFGDYNSLSGYAGVFFPSWTDRRANAREEIWTAKVSDPFCTIPGPPAIGSAAVTGANQVQVGWSNGAPAAPAFNVYRATGTCAAPGSFTKIGSAVAGSPFTDNTVSGTITYAYRVTGLDATGRCESPPSGCAQVTATGACTLPPSFAGLAGVANQAASVCGLSLAWSAGTPVCAGPVTYDVYRSTAPGFTPGPGNRIATGIAGTGYTDMGTLVNGTAYFYVVRAVDGSNGLADGNSVTRNAFVTGPIALSTLAETFEGGLSGGGFDNPAWTHGAVAGSRDWAWSAAQSQTPGHSWFSWSQTSVSDRVLVSPAFVPQAGTTLSFWHTYAFETDATQSTCWDAGTLEISTDGGASWSVLPDAAFTAGGFNGTVDTNFQNPIAGKRAWCQGTVGAMTHVTADLAAFAGAPGGSGATLRWHEGDDAVGAASGWYVDSVTVANAGVAGVCTTPPAAPLDFFTVTPCRLVDTRNPAGPAGGPALLPSAQRTFVLTGACGVPAGAKAVSLNLAITQPATVGDLRLFPADLSVVPLASAINFAPGQTRANNLIVVLDAGGAIKVQNDATGTVHLILDVSGYLQ